MDQLIQPGQEPPFGIITEPVQMINYQDYHYHHAMGKQTKNWRRNLAFKQFQFFSASSDEWILACAIADLKYLTAAFYYRYHFPTKTFFQYSCKKPLHFKTQIDVMPDHGEWRLIHGKNSFIMRALDQTRSLEVKLANGEYINLTLLEEHTQPLRLCTRTGMNGWTYTQKNAGLIARGALSCSSGKFDLQQTLGQHDWSAGFMRRETFWNWASLSGSSKEHGLFGLNVSAGVNETSFNENCYWLNGKRYSLHGVNFIYPRRNLFSTWEINTADNRLHLKFTPLGSHSERANAIFIASHFQQLFGYFSGSLILDDGCKLQIENVGIMEEHYAKW